MTIKFKKSKNCNEAITNDFNYLEIKNFSCTDEEARKSKLEWHHAGGNSNNKKFFLKNEKDIEIFNNFVNKITEIKNNSNFKTKKEFTKFIIDNKNKLNEDNKNSIYKVYIVSGKYGDFISSILYGKNGEEVKLAPEFYFNNKRFF